MSKEVPYVQYKKIYLHSNFMFTINGLRFRYLPATNIDVCGKPIVNAVCRTSDYCYSEASYSNFDTYYPYDSSHTACYSHICPYPAKSQRVSALFDPWQAGDY